MSCDKSLLAAPGGEARMLFLVTSDAFTAISKLSKDCWLILDETTNNK